MTNDYSTAPPPTNLVADNEWVKGDLPAETPTEAEAQPVAEAEAQAEAIEAAPAETDVPAEAELAATEEAPIEMVAVELEAETETEPAPFELQTQTAPPEALPVPEPEPAPVEPAPVPEEPVVVGQPAVDLSLDALVESLLFVAEGATPVARLAEALEVKPHEVEAALERLTTLYAERGLSLQRIKDKVQLTSAPAAAAQVQRFLGLSATSPLSKAALETLAIIAYQQPITRPQIEAVRGVNSDSVIKNLLTKGLVEENGRTEGPGRPTLYSTTPEFLQHFGLTTLAELPPLNLDELRREKPVEILKG
jgi:segregation and condensation protein B